MTNIKQLTCLLFVGLQLSLISCKKEEAIELQDFNFDTQVSTYVSAKNRYKTYDNYYQIKSEVIGVDTIYDGEFIGAEKPIRIEYRQDVFSYDDVLARFDDFDFNAVNFATTLDGKIMVMNGIVGRISLNETQQFVGLLNKNYGEAKKSTGNFIKSYDIYTWELKDRIIKYCVVETDESNVLKIGADTPQKTDKKESILQAYLFIVKKEYANQIIGQMSSGDLLYCN